jgi:hydroxypyruvate isomerase
VPDRHEPGTGEVNFPWLFAWIDRVGYRGWVSAEYIPAGRTLDGLGWLKPYL